MIIAFEAELWEWEARRTDSWVFVSLPVGASDDVRERFAEPRRGFGSVRVRVTVGATSWKTSIFPGGSGGAYVLPVKRAVREAEGLDVGATCTVTVEPLDG